MNVEKMNSVKVYIPLPPPQNNSLLGKINVKELVCLLCMLEACGVPWDYVILQVPVGADPEQSHV